MKVIQRFPQFVFILTKVSQKKKRGCVLLRQCTLVADSPSQEQPGYRDVWSLKFMGPIIYDFYPEDYPLPSISLLENCII